MDIQTNRVNALVYLLLSKMLFIISMVVIDKENPFDWPPSYLSKFGWWLMPTLILFSLGFWLLFPPFKDLRKWSTWKKIMNP